MVRILFVCLGNICRSPMAESMFTALLGQRGGEAVISSAATHPSEVGSSPYPAAARKLREEGIPLVPHRARLLRREDAERYDYFIGMDVENIRHMKRILGEGGEGKVFLLMEFAGTPRSIADPWYTGNFDETFSDLTVGLDALYGYLRARGEL